MNSKLIEQLQNGEISVFANKPKHLKKVYRVLKVAFPEDQVLSKKEFFNGFFGYKFYFFRSRNCIKL